jgi:hypothetical protein
VGHDADVSAVIEGMASRHSDLLFPTVPERVLCAVESGAAIAALPRFRTL